METGEPACLSGLETQESVGIWDHWMGDDHRIVDGTEVLDGAVVIPLDFLTDKSRVFQGD